MLGRLIVGVLSNPKVELRLEEESNCPDRFSRRLAWIAKPESLRERCSGGNEVDIGEAFGDGGELFLWVELVEGRALVPESLFSGWNALNTRALVARFEALSPNDVELRPIYLAREVECGTPVKTEGVSEVKVLKGKASIA